MKITFDKNKIIAKVYKMLFEKTFGIKDKVSAVNRDEWRPLNNQVPHKLTELRFD